MILTVDGCEEGSMVNLSPSIHKFDDDLIYSGLSAALGHELGPNGVSNNNDMNSSWHMSQ